VRFVVVYQREPHARQMAFRNVPQPLAIEERAALARKAADEFGLDCSFWIDDLSDQSREAFGDLPHWAVVVGGGGMIRHKLPWADPDELHAAVADLLRRERVGAKAEDRFVDEVQQRGAATLRGPAAARHDRWARLAWLAEHRPDHPDRLRWLCELAAEGPLVQRTWATVLLRQHTAQLRRAGPARARHRATEPSK
jgi:hypothetical protein